MRKRGGGAFLAGEQRRKRRAARRDPWALDPDRLEDALVVDIFIDRN
jgi:hypothetical protein